MGHRAKPRSDYSVMELTPKQREVVLGIRQYRTNKEIGKRMFLSESGVKSHIHRLLKQHGFEHRKQLVQLLPPEDIYDPTEITHLCQRIKDLEDAVRHMAGQLESSKEETAV